jgi:hypothetical protein
MTALKYVRSLKSSCKYVTPSFTLVYTLKPTADKSKYPADLVRNNSKHLDAIKLTSVSPPSSLAYLVMHSMRVMTSILYDWAFGLSRYWIRYKRGYGEMSHRLALSHKPVRQRHQQ